MSLNAGEMVHPDFVIARMDYSHPVYTTESVAAQAELPASTRRHLRLPAPITAGASTRTAAGQVSRRRARLGVTW